MVIRKKHIFNLILILIVVFFLFRIGFFVFLTKLIDPLLSGLNTQGARIHGQVLAASNEKDLLSENEQLKKQIADLQKENVDLRIAAQKFTLLSQQLGFISKQKNQPVLANIIGQSIESGLNYYILDQGSDNKVQVGAAVVVNDGYLVGKIVRVDNNHSYLLPLYDNHFLTSVDLLTKNSGQFISGLAQGKHSSGLDVKFVPLDKQVNVDDYIITSGVEKNIPRGLIVGKVAGVDKKPNEPFQSLSIEPLVSFTDLRIVMILVSD